MQCELHFAELVHCAMCDVVEKKEQILICIHTLTLERQSNESSTEKELPSVGNVIVFNFVFCMKGKDVNC